MDTAEKKVKTKAAAWTAGVHVLLLLLFLLLSYSIPATPPIEELGMEVNLGTSEDGSGTNQPIAEEDPATDDASVAYNPSTADKSDAKDMLRSNEPDAPSVAPTTTNNANNRNRTENDNRRNKPTTQQETKNNNNTRPQQARYVYGGSTGRGGNSGGANTPGTSEGNTTGKGDRGVPGGTPGAPNYSGVPGSGNGISHNLAKRNIVAFPPPEADFKEGGKVVIRITVNRDGAIVNKQIVSASNSELRGIALRKLDKVKFNKSTDAPEEQFGNITFVFKTRS
jgi:outer membrane biosynthesis protein TonB